MKKRNIFLTLTLDLTVVAFIFAAPFILRGMIDGVPNCWSLQMGIICPACGGTRCLLNLIQGNFLAAFKLSPMVILVVLYLCLVLLCLNFAAFTRQKYFYKILRKLTNHYSIIILAITFVVVGILRNFIFREYFLSILISV